LEHLKLLLNITSKEILEQIESGMKNIKQPVQLIFGEHDNIVPVEPSLNIIKKNIKELSVSIIKNAKHSPTIQNTEDTFNEIINFLKNN
jgi:esterase/lipase